VPYAKLTCVTATTLLDRKNPQDYSYSPGVKFGETIPACLEPANRAALDKSAVAHGPLSRSEATACRERAESEEMNLTAAQRAELESRGSATVRLKLSQSGPGRGASVSGFKCGDITRGDIEDWLDEKNIEEVALQQGTLRWAKIAGWAGIISIIATVIMGALAILLAK
jgi:hypothetical protein